MLALHVLRLDLSKSYHVVVDLLSEMPGVLEEVGLIRLPHYTALHMWFVRIPTKTWHAFQLMRRENPPATLLSILLFARDQSSRHYANRTHYRFVY